MSKRTQSIRSMFAAGPDEMLSADNKSALPRVTSGAVKSLKDTFSGVERDYQELREKLTGGSVTIEIDPHLVDPSPVADRFYEQDASSFETLKMSILERGQEIPILVREHPTTPGRFQSAYGHRRVRVLREIERPVKAFVRILSDEDLVLAQGIENSSREDLSFIERAIFALKLEAAGFQRTVIQSALSVDRAEVSKLIAVGKAVPEEIVEAIGRAPKVGRGRWQAFVDRLEDPASLKRVLKKIRTQGFMEKPTDNRFSALFLVAGRRGETHAATSEKIVARDQSGQEIATLSRTTRHCRIQIERDAAFAEFLMEQMPALYAAYTGEKGEGE